MEHTLNSNTRISKSLPKSYSKDDMCISSKEENKCKHLFKALKIQNGSLHLMQVWFKLLETLPRSMSLATSLSKTNFKVLELLISGRRYRQKRGEAMRVYCVNMCSEIHFLYMTLPIYTTQILSYFHTNKLSFHSISEVKFLDLGKLFGE